MKEAKNIKGVFKCQSYDCFLFVPDYFLHAYALKLFPPLQFLGAVCVLGCREPLVEILFCSGIASLTLLQ